MPVILGIIALLVAYGVWSYRARMAAEAARDIAGLVGDVAAAARRLGFRRRHDMHPVESLNEPDVAIAGAGVAFLELGGRPTSEQQDALVVALQSRLEIAETRAQEAVILGRWLMNECSGASPGFTRLVKRLEKLQRHDGLAPLLAVLGDVVQAAGGTLGPQQSEALDEVRSIFRLRGNAG